MIETAAQFLRSFLIPLAGLWLAAGFVHAQARQAGPRGDPRFIDGVAPDRVVMVDASGAVRAGLPARDTPPMIAREAGILHEFTREELALLRGVVPRSGRPREEEKPAAGAVVLRLMAGERSSLLRVSSLPGGEIVAHADGQRPVLLHEERWADLVLRVGAWIGAMEQRKGERPGAAFTLPGPSLVSSPITLDERTLKDRFTHGGPRLDGVTRDLSNERMHVRLPVRAADDPRNARGLAIYVHPGVRSGIPAELEPVADELGLIIIAPDNVGNDRDRIERMQLALDAVGTASARWVIDPSRVYLVGLSGGGKIATHTWACAPEVVRGVVAMVAIGSYEHLRRDDGTYWRGDFIKPPARVLSRMKDARIVGITGDKDGNQDYIRKALGVMRGDGLTARLDDFPDLGHEFPSAARIGDALRWVDEPAREARLAAEARASELAERARALAQEGKVSEAVARCVAAMEAAPYSTPAWQAAELWMTLSKPEGVPSAQP